MSMPAATIKAPINCSVTSNPTAVNLFDDHDSLTRSSVFEQFSKRVGMSFLIVN